MSVAFSARFAEQRNKKRLTQAQLAETLNKKRSTISGYETGGKEPDFDTLCEFAEFFGVSADYLVGLSNSAGNRDDALFQANSRIKGAYLALPAPQRDTVVKAYSAFYDILRDGILSDCSEKLNILLDLFSLIAENREYIKGIVARYDKPDSAFSISDVLAAQNKFKYDVESLLDRLLEEDLRVALGDKGE